MALTEFFRHLTVKGKDVFIVDDHHKALAAWAHVRRGLPAPPNLLTIDYHTDTNEAFRVHSHIATNGGRRTSQEEFRVGLVKQIDWRCHDSVGQAISTLRHDEHIDAATGAGVIGHAFCIQLSDRDASPSLEQTAYMHSRKLNWPHPPTVPVPRRPFTYAPAANHIYELPFDCFVGCQAMPHDDSCDFRQASELLETPYLDDQLARCAEITNSIGLPPLEAAPYILDIDLDAFRTRRAIHPADPATFRRLIRNAAAITVATEEECVNELWLDDQDRMTAEELLHALLAHIESI